MTTFRRGLSRLAVCMALAAAPIGCGAGPEAPAPAVRANVALVLPDGALVSAIAFAVTTPDGTTVLFGTKDYTQRATPLALTLSLASGKGYVLELAATSARGDSCDGLSQPFDVTAGKPASIDVTLVCDPMRGYVDECPVLQAWSATLQPRPAPPGTIDLYAFATDQDAGDVISYQWTAAAGAFSNPSSPSPVYTCASAAPALVTLTIDDHHQPQGCTTVAQLPVGCGAPQP
jgi:hypothetical protein